MRLLIRGRCPRVLPEEMDEETDNGYLQPFAPHLNNSWLDRAAAFRIWSFDEHLVLAREIRRLREYFKEKPLTVATMTQLITGWLQHICWPEYVIVKHLLQLDELAQVLEEQRLLAESLRAARNLPARQNSKIKKRKKRDDRSLPFEDSVTVQEIDPGTKGLREMVVYDEESGLRVGQQEGQEERPKALRAPRRKTCAEGHRLERARDPHERYCNQCNMVVAPGKLMYTCRACDCDICPRCSGKRKHQEEERSAVRDCRLAAALWPMNVSRMSRQSRRGLLHELGSDRAGQVDLAAPVPYKVKRCWSFNKDDAVLQSPDSEVDVAPRVRYKVKQPWSFNNDDALLQSPDISSE